MQIKLPKAAHDGSRFKPMTIVAAAHALTVLGHTEFNALMDQLGVRIARGKGMPLPARANLLAGMLLDHPNLLTKGGQPLVVDVIAAAGGLFEGGYRKKIFQIYPRFQETLELDGVTFDLRGQQDDIDEHGDFIVRTPYRNRQIPELYIPVKLTDGGSDGSAAIAVAPFATELGNRLHDVEKMLRELLPLAEIIARDSASAADVPGGIGHNKPPREYELSAADLDEAVAAIGAARIAVSHPEGNLAVWELCQKVFARVGAVAEWSLNLGRSCVEEFARAAAKKAGERAVDFAYHSALIGSLAVALCALAKAFEQVIVILLKLHGI